MGQITRTVPTTYYDTKPAVTLDAKENLTSNDVNVNNSVDNISSNTDPQNTEALTPDTSQDKSSQTDAGTKDKATDKTDTKQTDNKTEELGSISSVLLNFTGAITAFFNSLKLPFM